MRRRDVYSQGPRAGRTTAFHALSILLFVTLGGAATVGTLWVLDVIDLPGLGSVKAAGRTEDRTGKVAVPIAARAIGAYSQVRRDHLMDPATAEMKVVWLDAERCAENGVVTDARRVLNRVLAHDKEAAYVFTEDDFLPEGTRASPTAGIPSGMRGVRVDAAKIRGLHGLARGDRFDLVAVQSLDEPRRPSGAEVFVSRAVQDQEDEEGAWRASTRVIAQDARVVEPVLVRREPSASGFGKPVEEMFLAVREDEATELTAALAVGADIVCLPRSGLPGAAVTGLPRPREVARPDTIEVVEGLQRSTVVVPGDGR